MESSRADLLHKPKEMQTRGTRNDPCYLRSPCWITDW